MKVATIGSLGLSVTLMAMLATAACSDSTSSDAPPANDAAVPDTSPTNDDAGGDASTDACVSGSPASGITQLDNGERNGKHSALVMDDEGSPVVAYQTDDGTASASSIRVVMQRWIKSCSKWSGPVVVDTFGSMTDNGRQISLALDKSNGSIGVVYQAIPGTFGVDEHYEIRYAEWKKGAAAPSAPVRVEVPRNNDGGPASPGLGMANGKVFVAYQEPYRLCNESGCAAIVYRSRDAAGTWSAESVMPGNGKDVGGMGDAADSETAIAVDSAGNPAVAWISSIGNGGGGVVMKATFARPGDSAPTLILGNLDGTGTDDPWLDLAFDGTKPRAVVYMNRDANYSTDNKTAWFVESDDGTTWKTPVPLPHDAESSLDNYASIAIGAGGKVVIAFDSNASNGSDAFGKPKILSSTDLTTFTVGGPAIATYSGTAKYVSAKLDAAGKLNVIVRAQPSSDPTKQGAIFYREP